LNFQEIEESMRFWSNSVKLFGLMLVVGLAILSGLAGVQAQSDPTNTPAEPQVVQITTADGRTHTANYWALPADLTPESGAPAVAVMHALPSNMQTGLPLVEPLLQAGHNVLLVDWVRSDPVGDIQTWLDWLRHQPGVRPDAISTLGSGIGGNGAIISCANDEQCMTAIAVSPISPSILEESLGFSGLVESALSDGLSDRSVLLIGSHNDPYSDLNEMFPFAEGEIGLRLYAGYSAREGLFTHSRNADGVIQFITSWLNEHTPVAV
jgi:hypothetical protein